MFLINLKDYYPEIYTEDEFLWVSKDVYKVCCQFDTDKKTAWRNARRRPKNIPLEDDNALEIHLATSPVPLFELVQMNLTSEALHEAISTLSKKQSRRIYKYYFLGYSKTEIAKMENVNESTVRESLTQALSKLKKLLKNNK